MRDTAPVPHLSEMHLSKVHSRVLVYAVSLGAFDEQPSMV